MIIKFEVFKNAFENQEYWIRYSWFLDGLHHRTNDRPAIYFDDGYKSYYYYLNGKEYFIGQTT